MPNLTPFQAFMLEYRALCLKHKVMICPSMYDQLEVWPLLENDLSDLETDNFTDRTT